jgi:hypothetical protein
VTTVVGILTLALAPGHLAVSASVDNPLGVRGTARQVLEALADVLPYAIVTILLLVIASLILRFRRSRGAQRLQLKWFTYAALLPLTALALAGIGEWLLPGGPGEIVGAIGWTVFLATSAFGIPIATGIAILRYRLYDIDVVINRTLVYGSLTAALAVVYLGGVLVLQVLLDPGTGVSDLAVAGSTLLVAALVRPARSRIQAAVDRRFFRRRYDAAQALDGFTSRLRHEVDTDAVSADLRSVVRDTVAPAHSSVWLRP